MKKLNKCPKMVYWFCSFYISSDMRYPRWGVQCSDTSDIFDINYFAGVCEKGETIVPVSFSRISKEQYDNFIKYLNSNNNERG